MRLLAVGTLAILACSSPEDRSELPAAAPSAPASPPAPREPAARPPVTVHWGNVVRTDGCFFFSGPEGRDDQLVGDVKVETVEREGERIRVRIGTASFDGTYARGELVLSRTSTHEFNGAWTATETIRGTQAGNRLEARYAYAECELASKACPGRCTISADLTFSRGL